MSRTKPISTWKSQYKIKFVIEDPSFSLKTTRMFSHDGKESFYSKKEDNIFHNRGDCSLHGLFLKIESHLLYSKKERYSDTCEFYLGFQLGDKEPSIELEGFIFCLEEEDVEQWMNKIIDQVKAIRCRGRKTDSPESMVEFVNKRICQLKEFE